MALKRGKKVQISSYFQHSRLWLFPMLFPFASGPILGAITLVFILLFFLRNFILFVLGTIKKQLGQFLRPQTIQNIISIKCEESNLCHSYGEALFSSQAAPHALSLVAGQCNDMGGKKSPHRGKLGGIGGRSA